MKKQKLFKTMLAANAIMLLFSMFGAKNSNAQVSCNAVSESDVRYVNASLVDINGDVYNEQMRGLTWDEYNQKPVIERGKLDENYLLFGSCYGIILGGVQNGYVSPDVRNESAGIVQGLVKNKLVNGNIALADKFKNGNNLFPTSGATGKNNIYNEILTNWKFPFLKQENGYYSFDSDKYHVTKDYGAKTFKLHEGARGGFFPFNNCSDDTVSDTERRNLYFTAKFEIPFYMTTDGKVKNSSTGKYEDMVFNFSGDDDVWVFVDDTLILDLGGVHMKQKGNINFAKNQVYYEAIYNQSTNKETRDVTKTALSSGRLAPGEHTLRIFYMERAGGESNLLASFNLQSSGVKTRYMEKYTNRELDSVIKTGPVGEQIELEEKSFTDKVLVERPNVSEVTLQEKLQTFDFWYKSKYNLIVDYIDILSNEKIAESSQSKVLEDEQYSTNKIDITGYTFVNSSDNTSGVMPHEDVHVKYYYKYSDAKATINYIDQTTGQVLDTVKKVGAEGEVIPLEDRSFDDYVLVEKPTEQYKYTKKEQIINYYYKHKGKITVNYLDKSSKDKIGTEVLEGIEGDLVNSQAKEFDGYMFYAGPDSNEHTITRDKQEVNYYYIKQSRITVHYVDKESEQELDSVSDVVIEGSVFKTEEKEFEDYKLVEKPESEDVLIGRSDIEMYYYYQKLKFNLKVDMNLKQGTINDRYYELKNKVGKIEAEIKDANSSSTNKIYYIIRVTNNEEKIGSGVLVDYIPDGYMALQEDNPLWSISADRIYMDVDNINPNETREFELVLTKKEGVNICNTITNLVKIQAKDNLEETTLSDNEDKNDLVIMPRTGGKQIAIGITSIFTGLVATFIIIKRKLKKK